MINETVPSEYKKGQLIEIPRNHDILWYHDPDVPWISIFNPSQENKSEKRTSLGHARKWLERNVVENVHYQSLQCIDRDKSGHLTTIFFDSVDDYLAFKLVFPELCRRD